MDGYDFIELNSVSSSVRDFSSQVRVIQVSGITSLQSHSLIFLSELTEMFDRPDSGRFGSVLSSCSLLTISTARSIVSLTRLIAITSNVF